MACTGPAAYGVHLARGACRSWQQVVMARAVVASMHSPTVARILATASLHPPRGRDGKTATIDARFVTRAAKIVWRYARVAWLDARGAVVLCVDETPHRQVVVRRAPTHPLRRGQSARREFDDTRAGPVTCLAALNVYDGPMWGACVDAHDQQHFLGALGRLAPRYPWAKRVPLILANSSAHIAAAPQADLANHPRWRAFYTPPPASGLNQAELLLRAFSDKSLRRFAPHSRAELLGHLEARWPEDHRRFAPPFTWSWNWRDLYTWARKKGDVICPNTSATVH